MRSVEAVSGDQPLLNNCGMLMEAAPGADVLALSQHNAGDMPKLGGSVL